MIWQVGTNAIWQSPSAKPPPPTFDETTSAIREGLVELRDQTQADVILMDLQYVPAVLTPAKKANAIAMVKAIGELARGARVNVFRRFAFMKGMSEVEQVSFDRMIDPADEHRLHDSDWTTHRVAWAMKLAIVGGVDKAWYRQPCLRDHHRQVKRTVTVVQFRTVTANHALIAYVGTILSWPTSSTGAR